MTSKLYLNKYLEVLWHLIASVGSSSKEVRVIELQRSYFFGIVCQCCREEELMQLFTEQITLVLCVRENGDREKGTPAEILLQLLSLLM